MNDETTVKGINFFKSTDAASVKADLSAKQLSQVQKHVQKLTISLNELINILRGGGLFLANGKLLTGGVAFAAFRIQTLSLIFEYAQKYIAKGLNVNTYREFLGDLGYEVGFTYARELLRNLRDWQCIPVDDYALTELWSLFENDTGAGVTTVSRVNAETFEVSLKNNPLGYYYGENGEHLHCHFYNEYYRATLNEFMTTRPRLARDFMPDLKPSIWKVVDVKERPRKDLCVFECSLRQERLTHAFDLLHAALIDIDEEKYGDAIQSAREALTEAQNETLFPGEKEVPKNLYKAFQELLSKKDFKLMDESYQRASSRVHKAKAKDPATVQNIVRGIHYCIYEIERLNLSEEELKRIRSGL